MNGYQIADDGRSITCRRCGRTSYNIGDVENRYCGHCKVFHETTTMTPFRLAMRVEGEWWVAYLAPPMGMEGATEIARIRMRIVEESVLRRDDFIDLLTEYLADVIKQKFGTEPSWRRETAPDSERSGSA